MQIGSDWNNISSLHMYSGFLLSNSILIVDSFFNMEPTASLVRNHYSQKNQQVYLQREMAAKMMVNLKDPQEDRLITYDILHSVGETNSCDFIDLKCQEKDCTNTKINSKQSNDHWHSVVSFNIKEDSLANNHKVFQSLGYNSNKSKLQ